MVPGASTAADGAAGDQSVPGTILMLILGALAVPLLIVMGLTATILTRR